MIYYWTLYVIVVTLLFMSTSDFLFSIVLGLYLLIVLWPIALVMGFIVEGIKAITKK